MPRRIVSVVAVVLGLLMAGGVLLPGSTAPAQAFQASPAAGTLLVLVNSYQASDGTRYATSIQAARQIFLAVVRR